MRQGQTGSWNDPGIVAGHLAGDDNARGSGQVVRRQLPSAVFRPVASVEQDIGV